MKERSEAILEDAVRLFIKTGEPITSEALYREYDFGIKPAMIRWELNDLSDAGYFYQKHTSGGRYPTNEAYKFLIDLILEASSPLRFESNLENAIKKFLDGERDILINEMWKMLRVLSVGYEPEDNWFSVKGLKDLLNRLETHDKNDVVEVVNDFEYLPERLHRNIQKFLKESNRPQVFVGGSPITKSPELSVIAQKIDLDGGNIFLIAIGPKRMDYEKSLKLFKSFSEL